MKDINIFIKELQQTESEKKINGYIRYRYFLDNIEDIKQRILFVEKLILDLCLNSSIIWRILIWDDISNLIKIVEKCDKYTIYKFKEYQGLQIPGELILKTTEINRDFIIEVITCHLNFELN